MPILTRSRAKQGRDQSCPLLTLPPEISGQIWRYVLYMAPYFDTHICFAGCATLKSIHIAYWDREASAVKSDRENQIFRRLLWPQISLVNIQVYRSARPFVRQNFSFTICKSECLKQLIELVPKEIVLP